MNRLLNDIPLAMFEGATIVDSSTFQTTLERPGDTPTERVVLDVDGCRVQILRYDQDDRILLVAVGSRSEIMPLARVEGFVRQHAKGGAAR
jgi:hypothetical protein